MLSQILLDKEREVAQLKREQKRMSEKYGGTGVEKRKQHTEKRSFFQALSHPRRATALIAEVKKASPSKGIIREDFDPVSIAQQYERAGADCLSVLTDEKYFQGHSDFIARIKDEVPLPVLRKDFLIDPLQVRQSAQMGADAILLIAKALSAEQLKNCHETAREYGLETLIEVSTEEELEQVLNTVHPSIIGINNRDLHTFETDPQVTKHLLPSVPDHVLVMSESGINGPQVVKELEQAGAHGFLIGEYFMRQENIVQAVAHLFEETANLNGSRRNIR